MTLDRWLRRQQWYIDEGDFWSFGSILTHISTCIVPISSQIHSLSSSKVWGISYKTFFFGFSSTKKNHNCYTSRNVSKCGQKSCKKRKRNHLISISCIFFFLNRLSKLHCLFSHTWIYFIFICILSNATKSMVVNINPSANVKLKFIL